MNQKNLNDLAKITEALYLREYEKLRTALREEARIKSGLARLDEQVAQVRSSQAKDHAHKAVGADILWQCWETKTRRGLNADLARSRAKRLIKTQALTRAFGQKSAMQHLLMQTKASERINRARQALERLCQDTLLD